MCGQSHVPQAHLKCKFLYFPIQPFDVSVWVKQGLCILAQVSRHWVWSLLALRSPLQLQRRKKADLDRGTGLPEVTGKHLDRDPAGPRQAIPGEPHSLTRL